MTLSEAIEFGKQLIADWQWAYICQDKALMEKYCEERAAFEISLIRDYGEDFATEYFTSLQE